ncbi:putative amidohydrolase [Nocardioides thalensis]|uniref:Putative amidohydrolase n=1 Tax=Nocardioides thalensis TaxID=1914755 RepID=A0A853BUU1_9ACTN|nr:nitrilase family protein [Nocardioides thalensis]NYI99629.1 putative amidohydrolase [Nocardioides thalensis]
MGPNVWVGRRDEDPMSTSQTAVGPARVAVVQMDAQVGVANRKENESRVLRKIEEAAEQGADVVVLPELVTTGYSFGTRAAAFAHAEPVPDGPTVHAWSELAASLGLHIVGGLAERDGARLFDTAVLVGPDGYIGRYRKTHLWNAEKLWFTPGDLGYPVFDTVLGRIGLLICWDIWFPEVPRLLAAQGADLICSINNWVWTPPPLFDGAGRCMASYLTMTAAHVNNVFIAASDRIGSEGDAKFLGCSLIAGTNGWPVGEVADATSETMIVADLDLMESRSAPIWNNLNDLVRDRRTDLYDGMLGYDAKPWPR